MFEKISAKEFALKLLNGMAIGVVTALITNAAIGGLLSLFNAPAAAAIALAAKTQQFALPATIGLALAVNFRLNAIQGATLVLVCVIAAGNLHWSTQVVGDKSITSLGIRGVGDILNILLAAWITLLWIRWVGMRCGSFTMIVLPLSAALLGYLSTLSFPYTSGVTRWLGSIVNQATTLQPLIMGPLVGMAFGLAISTPLSSVALANLIGISGLAAGAANMGVNGAIFFLIFGSLQANKLGVPAAVYLGSTKIFTPLLFARPLLFIPLLLTCAVTGFTAGLMQVSATTATAGFGAIGLIGPVQVWQELGTASLSYKLGYIGIAYYLVPAVVAWLLVRLSGKLGWARAADWKFSY